MSEPLSTIVRAVPPAEGSGTWTLVCSLGHRTPTSLAEMKTWSFGRGRDRERSTCPTCRCLEALMGQGDNPSLE